MPLGGWFVSESGGLTSAFVTGGAGGGGFTTYTSSSTAEGIYWLNPIASATNSTSTTNCYASLEQQRLLFQQQQMMQMAMQMTQASAQADAEIRAADQIRQSQPEPRLPTPEQKRALELLEANLSPKQKKSFKEQKFFVVKGGKTQQKYRIRDAGHLVANVDVLDDCSRVTHRLCAHPDSRNVPLGDCLLAQKLMLEFDEDEFLRIANRHAA